MKSILMKIKKNAYQRENLNFVRLSKKGKNDGITLVALVVTIVVLLILAGVTITTLFSDNGIIKKAQDAANATNEAQKNTALQLLELEDELNKGLGQYTLKDILEEARTLRAKYEEAESNGEIISISDENHGYYDLQEKINNSRYKGKIVNLEGNLAYIGNDKSDIELAKIYGIDTELASVINNIGVGNPEAMYFEDGFIRMTYKWRDVSDVSDRETSYKKLITNSEDTDELNKITFEYLEGETVPYTGTKVYYEGKYIGTIVMNCDANMDRVINSDDPPFIRYAGEDIRNIDKRLYVLKAMDVNNDGEINDEDKALVWNSSGHSC